ncbi:MAG: hypothetical protein BWY76_02191 [bacterium ADurb.Bin429]|nr:MAG: hypothetical protein BWY76_02191 [bacterium ADurb.Bin429]
MAAFVPIAFVVQTVHPGFHVGLWFLHPRFRHRVITQGAGSQTLVEDMGDGHVGIAGGVSPAIGPPVGGTRQAIGEEGHLRPEEFTLLRGDEIGINNPVIKADDAGSVAHGIVIRQLPEHLAQTGDILVLLDGCRILNSRFRDFFGTQDQARVLFGGSRPIEHHTLHDIERVYLILKGVDRAEDSGQFRFIRGVLTDAPLAFAEGIVCAQEKRVIVAFDERHKLVAAFARLHPSPGILPGDDEFGFFGVVGRDGESLAGYSFGARDSVAQMELRLGKLIPPVTPGSKVRNRAGRVFRHGFLLPASFANFARTDLQSLHFRHKLEHQRG